MESKLKHCNFAFSCCCWRLCRGACRTARLRGAIVCYAVQNICIAMSAASAGLLVWLKEQQHEPPTEKVSYPLVGELDWI